MTGDLITDAEIAIFVIGLVAAARWTMPALAWLWTRVAAWIEQHENNRRWP